MFPKYHGKPWALYPNPVLPQADLDEQQDCEAQ
jgi:hypothetical protein